MNDSIETERFSMEFLGVSSVLDPRGDPRGTPVAYRPRSPDATDFIGARNILTKALSTLGRVRAEALSVNQ